MRYFTATGLVTQLLERRQDRELERFNRQPERLELIVLDAGDPAGSRGYVPFSKAGAELLFDVVGRASERTSLMLTTNLPFEEWVEIMGSEQLTGALLDRLTHRVHITGGPRVVRGPTAPATASANRNTGSKGKPARHHRATEAPSPRSDRACG